MKNTFLSLRFEQFGEVELDFSGVASVGQAFADELLRVWPLHHPQTCLLVVNACEPVLGMIGHIRGREDLPQPGATYDSVSAWSATHFAT